MSNIIFKQVETKRDIRKFALFPWKIYRNDPLWVPPFLSDRLQAFDRNSHAFYKHGDAQFFLVLRGGELVGTLCLAEDFQSNTFRNQKEGVFGFFDVINDYSVAEAMFDFLAEWAKQRSLVQISGPFNLDYENGYGVLVEGRDRPPVILCGHSPFYYLDFFQRYGFNPARGENLAYEIRINEDTPALSRLSAIADRVRAKGHVHVRAARLNDWDHEIDHVHYLLNKALAHIPDHREWPRESVQSLLAPFRRIADPELILFAEVDGKTVGFLPAIPDLNEKFKKVNGLRFPWNFLRLFFSLQKQTECVTIKSVLVLPEYWGFSGVSVLLFDEMVKRLREKEYLWVDLSLTSDDNPYTPTLAENMGANIHKRYQVFRLNFKE
jgi:hypothetical protein